MVHNFTAVINICFQAAVLSVKALINSPYATCLEWILSLNSSGGQKLKMKANVAPCRGLLHSNNFSTVSVSVVFIPCYSSRRWMQGSGRYVWGSTVLETYRLMFNLLQHKSLTNYSLSNLKLKPLSKSWNQLYLKEMKERRMDGGQRAAATLKKRMGGELKWQREKWCSWPPSRYSSHLDRIQWFH